MIAARTIQRSTFFLERCAFFLQTFYWYTGERCCERFPDENFENHLRVYRFAAQFCRASDVLDVGCGTGYGSSHLARCASTVTGIDLSWQAIHYADSHYRAENLRFLKMNAETLSFPDRSFDFVISTENFEHLHNQRAHLKEVARVLRKDGFLMLGTPNHELFLDNCNPYHTHEFVYEELLQALQESFGDCVIAESLATPPTEEGRQMRLARMERGTVGSYLRDHPRLWERNVDTTWLSNTHSFLCFARCPR